MKILKILLLSVLVLFLAVRFDFAKTSFQKKNSAYKALRKNNCITELTLKSEILFSFNSHKLKSNAKRALNLILNRLKGKNYNRILVEGYTDNIGSKSYNLRLSKERAQSVANYLISKGVPKNLVEIVGYGESHPIYPNDSKRHMALNRRVVINIYSSNCKNSSTKKESLYGVVEVHKNDVYVVVKPNCRCRQSYRVLGDYKDVLKEYAGREVRVFGKVKRFSPWSGEIYVEKFY